MLQSLHIPHIQFPLFLTIYFSMESLSQLMKQYWYIIINHNLYFKITSLLSNIFLCFKIPSRMSYYI